MESPTLSNYFANNVNDVSIAVPNPLSSTGYSWQPLQMNGTTFGQLFYTILNNKVVIYMYSASGAYSYLFQYYYLNKMLVIFN